MARYALAAGSNETPPFIRMAAVRPAVVVSPLAAQHFLNFVPLPHGHGSFRPTVIFHSFGRTFRMSHRRRKTQEAGLANTCPKIERLAAISSIRFLLGGESHISTISPDITVESETLPSPV